MERRCQKRHSSKGHKWVHGSSGRFRQSETCALPFSSRSSAPPPPLPAPPRLANGLGQDSSFPRGGPLKGGGHDSSFWVRGSIGIGWGGGTSCTHGEKSGDECHGDVCNAAPDHSEHSSISKRPNCGGINGRYRSTECPHHRQFQPLVQRFSQDSSCVPFLVGVLHYRMHTVEVSKYSGGPNLYLR